MLWEYSNYLSGHTIGELMTNHGIWWNLMGHRFTETAILGVHLTVIIALYDCTNSWNSLRLCPLASRFYTNKLERVVHVHTPQSVSQAALATQSRPPGILKPSEIWVGIPKMATWQCWTVRSKATTCPLVLRAKLQGLVLTWWLLHNISTDTYHRCQMNQNYAKWCEAIQTHSNIFKFK